MRYLDRGKREQSNEHRNWALANSPSEFRPKNPKNGQKVKIWFFRF
jgi:hypothetical protein